MNWTVLSIIRMYILGYVVRYPKPKYCLAEKITDGEPNRWSQSRSPKVIIWFVTLLLHALIIRNSDGQFQIFLAAGVILTR